jgi:hypothetical protein
MSNMQETGLLIVGSQRSGTTLLNRIVNAHPDVALLFQQSNFLRLDPQSYRLAGAGERQRLIQDARRACSLYSRRFDDSIEAGLIAEFAENTGTDISAVYRSLIQKLLPATGRRYWGEKYAGRAVDALKFIDIVPDGKILHIVRDPRDVCASEKQRLKVQMNKPEGDTSFLLTAYDWKIGHLIGGHIQRAMPGNYLRLRYEDLIADPAGICRNICSFLDLPFTTEMLEADKYTEDDGTRWEANTFFESNITTVRSDFRDRWQRVLTPQEALFVDKFCQAGMRDLEYPARSQWRLLVESF